MKDLCAIYIARKQEGIESWQRFARSLAGSFGYDLCIVYKGFANWHEQQEWHHHAPANAIALELPDDGFDLTAYRRAAEVLLHKYVICFNSHTEAVCDEWPQIILKNLERGHKLVGAFGSYESFQKGVLRRLIYPSFPNPHIRTNAFAMPRELLLELFPKNTLLTKVQCHLLESGYNGLTRQIEALANRVYEAPVTVDRFWNVRRWHQWWFCNMFRNQYQGDLMFTDNQTRFFDSLSVQGKGLLERQTWGKP